MSLVPYQLNLKDQVNQTATLDIIASPAGESSLVVNSGSLKIEAPQSLIVKGYDAYLQVGGNVAIASADFANVYRLPNPNSAMPVAGQTVVFNNDGTSQFETIAVPQNVAYNPAQADQAMAQYNISNVGKLSVAKPTGAGQDPKIASFEVVENEAKFTSEAGVGAFTFDKNVSAPDVNSATYGLEAVGAQSQDNADAIDTLNGQVAALESKVANLITVIFNLTGISITYP